MDPMGMASLCICVWFLLMSLRVHLRIYGPPCHGEDQNTIDICFVSSRDPGDWSQTVTIGCTKKSPAAGLLSTWATWGQTLPLTTRGSPVASWDSTWLNKLNQRICRGCGWNGEITFVSILVFFNTWAKERVTRSLDFQELMVIESGKMIIGYHWMTGDTAGSLTGWWFQTWMDYFP